jgi:beta-phosphoglucomutase-like phosphatase (HAD superfamily)
MVSEYKPKPDEQNYVLGKEDNVVIADLAPDDLAIVAAYLLSRYAVLGLDMDGSCVNNERIHHRVAAGLLEDNLPYFLRDDAHEKISWDWWQDNIGSGQDGIHIKFKALYPDFKLTEADFCKQWPEKYNEKIAALSDDELKDFVRPGLKQLVKIFNDAGRPYVVYSVSERPMLDANFKAIHLNPSDSISGDEVRKMGDEFQLKAYPHGWQVLQNRMSVFVPAYQWLILEDTNKGVNAICNFGGDAIEVCYREQYPHSQARYHARTDENILMPFLRAARDEQRDIGRQRILVSVPSNYALK